MHFLTRLTYVGRHTQFTKYITLVLITCYLLYKAQMKFWQKQIKSFVNKKSCAQPPKAAVTAGETAKD